MAKILLIEDDADQVLMYKVKFELYGHNLISANDGIEGLAMAEKEKPDIILIDLLMDKMGGIEVLENLKKNSEIKNIPAIIITNLEKQGLAKKVIGLGAVDFIVKSKISLKDVLSRIEKHLKK
jgi:CheY-like chemotaxis protein